MKQLSVFRLPIFWLFLGPPIFRTMGARDTAASLESSVDLWNAFRIAWWLFFGLLALRDLLKARGWLHDFLPRTGTLPWIVALWLAALFLSALASPAPLFTLANAGMLTILVVAAADLGVKVYSEHLSITRVLRGLLYVSVGFLLLIGVLFLVSPDLVGFDLRMGIRIRGGDVAYAPLLALVALFLGLYFWLEAPPRAARGRYLLAVGLGLLFLALGQTRSAYVGFVAGLLVFLWLWNWMGRNVAHLMTSAALLVIVLCAGGLLYVTSSPPFLERTVQYVVREQQSLSTLSGRTEVMAEVIKAVQDQPLGLGFSAGPRVLLQSEAFIDKMYSDAFGNAHNAYLEVLAGSGYAGFLAWMAIVFYVAWNSRRPFRRSMIPVAVLLVIVLLEGVTESGLVLPFKQTSALFWMVTALVAVQRARSTREAKQRWIYA